MNEEILKLIDKILMDFLKIFEEKLNSDIYPKNLVEIDGELVEYGDQT